MRTTIFNNIFHKSKKKLHSNYLYDTLFIKKNTRKGKKVIHVIGDSHVSVFTGLGTKENQYMQPEWPEKGLNAFDYFKAYRIGAVTAYNSYNKIGIIKKILQFKSTNFDQSNDIVLLCFGEIDVRAHIAKQAELKNISIEESIEICITRYLKTILTIRNLGFKVAVWGVIASTRLNESIISVPVIGNCKERNIITSFFNTSLQKLCKKNDLTFISIYNEMVDDDGLTKEEYLMDGHHLDTRYLQTFFIQNKYFGLV